MSASTEATTIGEHEAEAADHANATALTPLLIVSGEIAGRGHALTIDSGRREVAETALASVRRFA
jgi:hypothetical protein